MNYSPILNQLRYWGADIGGSGDEFRRTHDRDCVLTGGNLFADTIFSLWLPLRYSLNFFETPRWSAWVNFEYSNLRKHNLNLKTHVAFLHELEENTNEFLPQHEITDKLLKLFSLGQKRSNIMILPDRRWNKERGGHPYYDYLPHFLHDKLNGNDTEAIVKWIVRESISIFFKNKIIDKEHLIDLAGTGNVCCHSPKEILLPVLLDNYSHILEQREIALSSAA